MFLRLLIINLHITKFHLCLVPLTSIFPPLGLKIAHRICTLRGIFEGRKQSKRQLFAVFNVLRRLII